MPRFPHLAVLLVLAAAVGCGGSADEDDLSRFANPSVFKDDAPSNRRVGPNELPDNLVDQNGNPVDLLKFRGKKNLVLVITRGIPQSPGGVPCPYCVAQANSLIAHKPLLDARDAEVLILFPGPADKVADFVLAAAPSKNKLPFTLALDRDLAVCDRLGVRGDLAKPSTYILDKKGRVVYAYVGETRTDRPSARAILGQLDKLQPAPPTPAGPPAPTSAPATGPAR